MSDKNGRVIVDGVTIAWTDTRYMGHEADDPTGDMDLRGEYRVAISVQNGELKALNHAVECARRLQMISAAADVVCPVPGSTHVLRLAGVDDTGVPVWRVVANGRVAHAISATQLSQIDPAQYTNAGPVAMRTIAWMRAVGRITSGWRTKEETWHVLHFWDAATLAEACLVWDCPPAAREIVL